LTYTNTTTNKESTMATQEIFFAVIATVEDGEITGFEVSGDALVGDAVGNVRDAETGEWSSDWSPAQGAAFKRLSAAVRKLNGEAKRPKKQGFR